MIGFFVCIDNFIFVDINNSLFIILYSIDIRRQMQEQT